MDTIYDDRPRDAAGRPLEPVTGPGQFADTRDPETRRVWLVAGLVALGIIILLLIALIAARNRVQTAEVQRRNIMAWESLSGTAVAPANKYAVINCHCDAPVSRVFTSVGATVHRGDIIAELSHPTAQAAQAVAQQELAAAQSAYNSARDTYAGDIRRAQQDLAQAVEAQQALPAVPGEVPTGMEQRAADVTGSSDVTRPGNITLPQASVTADMARARVTAAQQRLQQNLVPYEQRLAAAQQSFQEAQRGLNQSFIRAPITGQVLEQHAQPGEPISSAPNTLIATIADLSSVTIHAPLTQAQQETVAAGMPVQVRVTELPDQALKGTIKEITNELGPAVVGQPRELRRVAIISFVNEGGAVKPNMNAQVLVQTAELPFTIAVPNGAIDRDRDGRAIVRVREGGRWVVKPVRLGPTDGVQTAVLSGLQEGQIVQVHPHRERELQRSQPEA